MTTRLALIVPASNTVMEPDFHRALGDRVNVSTWRIHLDSVTREAEERMLEVELPRCLGHLATTNPDVVVFGCTSAGALGGLSHDARIRDRIRESTGAEVLSVVGSMVDQLEATAPARVGVFTPYAEDLTGSVAKCVTEAGFDVVRTEGMGILDNRDIGAVPPAEITEFVTTNLGDTELDALFLSCTNWRAIESIDQLSGELGVPVLSSNQVTLASVQQLVHA